MSEFVFKKKAADHFNERLNELRIQNDKKLGELETAFLRGRIHAVKEFLSYLEDGTAVDTLSPHILNAGLQD